jgi:hypothetical protein
MQQIMSEIKQTGYLTRRFTKKDTMSREWGFYVNLEASENTDIEIKYFNGRMHSDMIEKLGLLEDILEKISISQLMSLVRTVGGKNGRT